MTDRHDDILEELWRILDTAPLSDINVLELLAGERDLRTQYLGPRLVVDNTTADESAFPTDTPFDPDDPDTPLDPNAA